MLPNPADAVRRRLAREVHALFHASADEPRGTARALGADPVPTNRRAADALLDRFRPELVADARSRRVRDLILGAAPTHRAAVPVQALLMQAAIDLLPGDARALHGLTPSRLSRPALNLATFGLSRTLRWALGAR